LPDLLGPEELTPAEREMIYNAYRDKQWAGPAR
jgi:hypothetical protein